MARSAVLTFLALGAVAGCAPADPGGRFDRLLRAGAPLAEDKARRALPHAPLSREESASWRARASGLLGRRTESGLLVFDAPSLAPQPDDGKIERKKPDAPPLLRDRKVRVKVRLPDGYAPDDPPRPLIVFLHGSWTNHEKAGNFWKGTEGNGAVVLAVDSNRGKIDGAGWNHPPEIGSVLSAVREMKLRYAVDPSRVYLFGHSNGVGGIFRLAAFHPDRFAGLSAFSSVMTADTPEETLPLSNWGAKPIFQWQGGKDENRTSLADRGRAFSAWLKGKGFSATYLEDPEGTHRMTPEGVRAGWEAVRGAAAPRNPRSVFYRGPATPAAAGLARTDPVLRHARPGRCHWLEASELDRAEGAEKPPMYQMRGTVDGNRISIETRGIRRIRLFLNDALVDLDAPVTAVLNGREAFSGPVPRTLASLAADILERGCVQEAADAVVTLTLE